MKKFKRAAITAGVAALGFLSACGNITPSSVSDSGSGGEQRLNLAEADLIADITDNAKYLNPDLLYDVVRPEDSDKIGVIVTMNTDAIADIYFENSQGYETLTAYALSPAGQKEARDMLSAQRSLAAKLQSAGLISGIRNSYTTLLNGFSAETTFGQYRKISEFMGVEKVTLSEVYALPLTQSGGTSPVENVVDVYETGIFNSSSVDFTGEHTAVAILDSGFDYHHTVFQNMPDQPLIAKTDVSAVLSSTKASEMTKDLIVSDVYINSKIPFSYDYADKDPDVTPFDSEHGTHVAGIIGGSDQNITGVAVNTQLVLLKVFSDLTSGAATDSILAALEDAVLLKVDAINMSLGSSCGFSRLEDEDYLNSVYDKIEKAGISLVVAASNDYSSAYGGANGNTNKVTNPDSATVGSPSTYGPSLSVASISGTKDKYIEADDGYVFFFNEANSLAGKPYDFFEMLDLPATGEKKIEYVTVPGVGLRVNYSSIDVKGKIALVKRGTNTFEEKAQIARDAGAIGCIIYNNIGGDILMSAGKGLKIPLISISKDDGSQLAMKNGGYLTFSRANLAGPFMSDFSSWGPNPDLTLKPEITAHGGNILSSVPGNKYDQMSGTSMASPNMCGIMVLIRQYIKEKFSTLTATEVTAMANELVMSSATIALDRVGNPYSPRKQGAGLASLYNAVNTKAYLTVDGKDRAKIELGDDPEETGEYTLKFNLNNISADSLSYDLKDITMTESLSTSDKDYVAEKATLLNPALMLNVSGNGRADGQKVTVDPHGTLKISLTLKLSETEKKSIRKNFPNGMYVEGFVKLVSANRDQIDLSIPYLAFFWRLDQSSAFRQDFL